MLQEASAAPSRVAELVARETAAFEALGRWLRAERPPFAITVGRGSSDHAGLYARYLIETELGVVTASAALSIVTAYRADLHLAGALVLALSQSGASPDLVQFVEYARAAGGRTVALLNQTDSPLGRAAETTLDLHAGDEHAVAATKSFLCCTTAVAMLVRAWSDDRALGKALEALPDDLAGALRLDWSPALNLLRTTDRLLVIARGRSLAVAAEAALKLKEVAGIHAEALSAAEVLHGPLAVVDASLPIVVIAVRDDTLASVLFAAERLKAAGAPLAVISAAEQALALADVPLRIPASRHPALDPLLAIQAFYPFAAVLAQARGLDPDRPPHLAKVTRTL